MVSATLQRRLGISLGVLALCGGSLALGYVARAQVAPTPALPGGAPAAAPQAPAPAEPTPPRPRRPGAEPARPPVATYRLPYLAPGAYAGAYAGAFFGPTALTAAGNSVIVLRGHTLYSYDAHTLRLNATAELPAPPAPPVPVPLPGGLGVGVPPPLFGAPGQPSAPTAEPPGGLEPDRLHRRGAIVSPAPIAEPSGGLEEHGDGPPAAAPAAPQRRGR